MLIVVAVCLFVGIALVIYTVFEQAEERSTVRASLRQLDGYEVENLRDRELLKPVGTRVIAPALLGFVQVGRRLTPVGYVDQTRHKLLVTGKAAPEELDQFLAIRVITIAAIPVLFVLWWFVLPLHGQTRLVSFLLFAAVLVLGPDARLNREMHARQETIRRALPDILDLLTISVEAGLGFEQALDRTVSAVPGALSDEFTRMLNETRAGASRADAMRSIEQRTDVAEVRSFVLAILQADTFGVSIGRILRAQADEMRIKRRQLAQERAMKAPVKMLLPMVFCIFPALFVIVLGPAVINIIHGFK
jgi:tight adherence protein C